MATKINWIESGGGPLLFAPRSSAREWLGADSSKLIRTQTDYARACLIEAEIAVISIGGKAALVLGDEPDRTALVPGPSATEVLIVRWRWADSEESLLSGLKSQLAADALSFVSVGRFVTSSEEYLLFDSACSGAEIDSYLSATLQAGSYSIETAIFNPNGATCALIHRLRSHISIRSGPAN